jgi:glucose/arabinose dehydrogenase
LFKSIQILIMKNQLLLLLVLASLTTKSYSQTTGPGSRMNEVFKRIDIVPVASGLDDPWEITYGPDDSLWVTEAKGYVVKKFEPSTPGPGRTILNLSIGSSFTPASYLRTWNTKSPQGGMMGLAIHPDFMNVTDPKKFVYIAYVKDYLGQDVTNPTNGEAVSGHLFKTSLVRFEYVDYQLVNPETLCDTITGSNDHNSGRLIIKPESDGVNYLYYAVGDLGAGQFDNLSRTNKAQMTNSYEGKILRFNLESDGDATGVDKWIPNDNPFNNGGIQSAVWATGIRNNQGFAYGVVNGVGKLYGSSHGPFSDDEINIIEKGKNYGHPVVIGKNDGNYDGSKAGPSGSSLPLIVTEAANVTTITAAIYRDPIYTFYAAPKGSNTVAWSVKHIYNNVKITSPSTFATLYGTGFPQDKNNWWASEGISGMDIYTNSMIPGWKNSLLTGTLKGGKVLRQKLSSDGSAITTVTPTDLTDTIGVFRSVNRFRDVAFSKDGKSMFVVIDKSQTTSGPTTTNPILSACAGCVQKYTFLGYETVASKSTLPDAINVAAGTANQCMILNTVNINSDNTNYWVPITDSFSNIVAEIKANGNILGNVTASVYTKSGAVREHGWYKTLYLNRNITITPQNQPSSGTVNIRLYLTEVEYQALRTGTNSSGQGSSVSGITSLGIFKNNDVCGTAISGALSPVINNFQLSRAGNGYVLQATISSFSTFYIANSTSLLPINLLSFNGAIQNNVTQLKWTTVSETETTNFVVQRSTNGLDFDSVTSVAAKGHNYKTEYQAADGAVAAIAAPSVFYRLKVNNTNGGYSYSNVVSFGLAANKGTILARPNPVTTDATIEINSIAGESVLVQLTDNTGKTVYLKAIAVRKGSNHIALPMSTLSPGTYYLKVTGAHINQVTKLQKL